MCEWMVHFLEGITSKICAHIPGASDRAAALKDGNFPQKSALSQNIFVFGHFLCILCVKYKIYLVYCICLKKRKKQKQEELKTKDVCQNKQCSYWYLNPNLPGRNPLLRPNVNANTALIHII